MENGRKPNSLSPNEIRRNFTLHYSIFLPIRYLYNESVTIQSVMTALTTLYAAHKYMCPGLARIVVNYLREHLSEKNVLLVLQVIAHQIIIRMFCEHFATIAAYLPLLQRCGGCRRRRRR